MRLQSILDPAATEASQINHLWWIFLWILTAVYLLTLAATLLGIRKSQRSIEKGPVIADPPPVRARARNVVSAAVLLTVGILFAFFIFELTTTHALQMNEDPDALRVRVIGRQWWWEVQYLDPEPSKIAVTANEIHVPLGRRVEVELEARDVIHSFWAPNFNGKRDLVPGYTATNTFVATRAGSYRGQCAEYCGAQHAHMRFVIVAEPKATFEAWLARQRQPAHPPETPVQQAGRQIFETRTCILCHTVQGTSARATVGPNLTHVGSRAFIAAGTLPVSEANFRKWIVDPQAIKPSAHMPQNTLAENEISALSSYLTSLK